MRTYETGNRDRKRQRALSIRQDSEGTENAEKMSAEREALARKARTREEERLAGIERRRGQARRTVLGLLAAARAANNEPATASWTTSEWERIGTWTQEQCWKVLRPALGLQSRTFAELIRRKQKTELAIRNGERPPPDQKLAKGRRKWRHSRRNSWLRIGKRVLWKSKEGAATPADTIRAMIAPRGTLPEVSGSGPAETSQGEG